VKEDANTFAGNATKKAVEIAHWLAATGQSFRQGQNAYVLADDSGLEVDALQGAPGVHSARFAALDNQTSDNQTSGNSLDQENNAKLLRLLEGLPLEKRTARFRCVLALAPVMALAPLGSSPVCDSDEIEMSVRLFEGVCEGHIGFSPRGAAGFGYDPLFTPAGHSFTFAELGPDVKNRISHRARALQQLKVVLSATKWHAI
jgi:XTP/dITP diphosphohydrolase